MEGGPIERARVCLCKVGAHDHPIVHGGLGGAKKREPSHRGSAFPGRCATRLGEGGRGSNGGGYNGFGCGWRMQSSNHARGAGWCQKVRTELLELGFSWEMPNEAGRGWRGVQWRG